MLAERENEIAEATDMLSWFQQTNYFMRDLGTYVKYKILGTDPLILLPS